MELSAPENDGADVVPVGVLRDHGDTCSCCPGVTDERLDFVFAAAEVLCMTALQLEDEPGEVAEVVVGNAFDLPGVAEPFPFVLAFVRVLMAAVRVTGR